MEEIIKLVKTYRLTSSLDQRLTLANELFSLIEPDLRFFVFNAALPQDAEDVSQEILRAVAMSLGKFAGGTTREFWAWCYRIARNKLNDHYRRQGSDRMQPVPMEELRHLVDASAQGHPISAADRLDLDYAMKLLTASKPECYEFLWRHFVIGLDYAEIAEEQHLNYDAVRMKIGRCLAQAQSLVS